MLNQVRKSSQCGIVDHVVVNDLEDPVDLVDPFHDCPVGIINGDQIPHKGLEKMMMGVDQPRIDEFAPAVDYLGAFRLQTVSNGQNLRSLHQQIAVPVYLVPAVAGYNRLCIPDQYLRSHKHPPDSG